MDLSRTDANQTFQQAQIREEPAESRGLQLHQYPLPGLSKRTQAALLEDLKRLPELVNGHIARVYQVYWTGSTLNILQEAVPSESLSLVINRQILAKQERRRLHFAESQGWKLLHELALILSTLHQFGLPYVPLSLENLKLQGGQHLKIELWFAGLLGKYTDSQAQGLTQAPEEHYEQKRDRRADVWTMGALLYRLLAFKGVFGGGVKAWPAAEGLNSLQHEPLPPCYSQKLSNLLIKMMYKRPENRLTVAQVLSEVPLPFKLRYSPPSLTGNLPENSTKPQQNERKSREKEENVPLLKAPFRCFEPKSRNKETFRRSRWANSLQADKMRLNSSTSPRKLPSATTVSMGIAVEEPASLSKTQTRGTSRLSSRESLSLSYERQPKRRAGSRPTIDTLSLF